MSERDNQVRLHVRLHLAEGVGAITYRRLIDHFGDAPAVFEAAPEKVRGVEGIGPKAAAAILAVDDEAVEAELAAADEAGVAIVPFTDEAYPAALKNIIDPPAVLYVRGRLEANDAVALAVVGSRRCTYYGMEQADRFGGLLGRAGFTVVSGGARGIDTAAHRGALAAEGRTIAVMGCGLSRLYPRENVELFDRIIAEDRGAIVSSLPMATEAQGRNFPRRNRIISGLSQGVLVVEAAYRSGSLITARLAGEQGRQVYALPGRVDSPFSQGTNALIRDGAVLVQNLDDILEHLDELGDVIAEHIPAEAPAVTVELSPLEREIVAALDGEARSIDHLAAAAGQAAREVVAAMTMLTIKGIVASQPGNVFALTAAGRAAKGEGVG